jgi:hypothetical protein
MFEITITRMKRTKAFIILALLAAAVSFWQCGGDSTAPPDPKDEQLTKLSQTWKATSVTFASGGAPQPVTGYDNFEVTISGTKGQSTFNYTTTGRPASPTISPWGPSGTFTFGTEFSTVVTREDGTTITYSVTATQLQMTFTYTGAGYAGSRVNSVNGNWTFTFVP